MNRANDYHQLKNTIDDLMYRIKSLETSLDITREQVARLTEKSDPEVDDHSQILEFTPPYLKQQVC